MYYIRYEVYGRFGKGHNSRSCDRKRVEANAKDEAKEREKTEAEARKIAQEHARENGQ